MKASRLSGWTMAQLEQLEAVAFALPPIAGMTVLGTDEFGRAAAWVHSFGGAPGTGFVRLPGRMAIAAPDVVRRATEFGIAWR
jgi:hypothetical protein